YLLLNCFDSTSTIAINNQTITDDLLDNSFIYICGGLDGTTYLSQCYKYNKQTGIWETIQSLTTKRDLFSLISYDSKLYAIGGYNGKTLNSIETYDTLTNKWQSIAPMNIIRHQHDATVIQNTIYVCGGLNGNVFKTCEYYSLTTNEWHFAQPMATERRCLELVANDGFIYAIGGHNGKEYLNTMERYDIKTQQWQPMGYMRYARGYFGSALFMGKLYVCGGLGNTDQKSCESYDPKANQWTPIASMLLDRHYFKLIAFNEKLYALGGQGKDGKPTETVEVYDYKSNQWYYTTSLPKKIYAFGATV
ncbi:kelch-like protein 5, partial [Oppia nitens]|uniref:kelch-like protein 5 n=1 Tax=Oppia nitens TaxID=1686743 RepID=UPI0023DBD9B0